MRAIAASCVPVLLALLGGCASEKPMPPLMSPISQVTDFGYSNRDLTNGRIEVVYLGPARRVSTWRASRQEAVDQAKAQAEELATLRAAQVALDRGKPAFDILDKHTDIEVDVRDYYDPYPFGWYPYRWSRAPFYAPYPPYYGSYRDAYAQAQSKLTIQLLDKTQPGALDARETADRLGRKYAPPPAKPADKPDAQKPPKENT